MSLLTKGTYLSRNISKAYDFGRMASSVSSKYSFETLLVTVPHDYVFHVEFNRPQKANSMTKEFWSEFKSCLEGLSGDSDCRVVILSGKGKHFSSGMDMSTLADVGSLANEDTDIGRSYLAIKELVANFQKSFTAIEKCRKPVICAIHGGCIGGSVDLITAADIRYSTSDAYFQIKEVELGLAADVGTLQRLPKVVGNESLVRELAFTGRKFSAEEALSFGLTSKIFPDVSSLMKHSFEMAKLIAEKSPIAVQTSKEALIHARDHTVDESLNYIATMNGALLQSEDVRLAIMAMMAKEKPKFAKL